MLSFNKPTETRRKFVYSGLSKPIRITSSDCCEVTKDSKLDHCEKRKTLETYPVTFKAYCFNSFYKFSDYHDDTQNSKRHNVKEFRVNVYQSISVSYLL